MDMKSPAIINGSRYQLKAQWPTSNVAESKKTSTIQHLNNRLAIKNLGSNTELPTYTTRIKAILIWLHSTSQRIHVLANVSLTKFYSQILRLNLNIVIKRLG